MSYFGSSTHHSIHNTFNDIYLAWSESDDLKKEVRTKGSENNLSVVQRDTLLIGRESITLDQALATLKQNDMFMVKREGEENKCVGHRLYSEGSYRGRTKEKKYQERRKSQGRSDLSDKEMK